jgi:hypothetical protein
MAIDTDAEKHSMLTFGVPFFAPVPIATGDMGEDEKAAFLGLFWEGLEQGGEGEDDTMIMPTREGMIDPTWFEFFGEKGWIK